MRLIDADKKELRAKVTVCFDTVTAFLIHCLLDDAPTVDAVEVVRCKECQFCLYNEAAGTYKCRSQQGLSRFVDPTDFCSWGERVIEDETNKC